MGSLPSREKPFSIPMAAAVPTPSPMPTQAGECSAAPSTPWWAQSSGALSPMLFPTAPNSFLALALCDFPSGSDAPTVLRMGEQLNVLSEDGEWWLVASKVSGKECLIPSSCVAKVWHRWLYEGISREKAEELLLRPGNHSGSFLIRQSQTRKGCYSLSVRRTELTSWDSVTHYRIHRLENGWLYISPRLTFSNLHDLVDHYTECGEGLCCALRQPCSIEGARAAPALAQPTVVKKPSLNWDKIDSSVLLSEAVPPPEEEEDSPISLGLREAISSYLLLTDGEVPEMGSAGKGVKNS
uniref:Src like adaptor 2 n=1 Tax=Anas platyrhynchos platyrhynchos TaxID=8840 RepID=A0A493TAN4_ANAPP